ncbi:PREDICTED: uncharacterized protein LOC109169212 [Ipomoea nil]|uniref:uncharacterized protein LOC109169212 n=1 Tax=Ipomoea nil TaxID=35883 RepID=UPI000900B106|nr:PREDICTED: uncharacterized protein LOC109169212 [Ipomoea nil]
MGKSDERQLPLHQQQQGGRNGSGEGGVSRIFCCCCCCEGCPVGVSRIFRGFNFKCVFVLLLTVAVLLSAVFWVFPRRSNQSGFDAKEAIKLSSTVQAYFMLEKPVSDLVPNIARLEYDIYGEIGVPSTKVAILSIHQADLSNQSDVIFGVLSDPVDSSINQLSLDLLKMSFIDIFLQQANLTLTTSIFGQPFSFEILKFPDGITIIPEPRSTFWDMPQNLFNFTLYNSIEQIKSNFAVLKEQLKSGLHLRPYEDIFVMVKNNIGSTRDPPVTIEVSAVTDVDVLPPERLKQLARIITDSPPSANLGLDNSVFGKVKQISLSSFLSHSIQAVPPTAAPASAPSPSPVQYDPEPSSAPSYTSHTYAPTPGEERGHPPSHVTASPVPSQAPASPHRLGSPPCGPSPSPASHAMPTVSPGLSPLAAVSYYPSEDREELIEKGFVLASQVSSGFSLSPSSRVFYNEMHALYLNGFLTILLCWIW